MPNNEKCSFSVAENELNKLDFGLKLRFLRKIVGYAICPVHFFLIDGKITSRYFYLCL